LELNKGQNSEWRRAWQTGSLVERCIAIAGIINVYIMGLALFVMMLVGTADVIGTKFAKWPIPGAYESTSALMVVIVFGGIAYAQLKKRHISVALVASRLPSRAREILSLTGLVLGAAYFGVLTWRCALFFWESWLIKESEASLIHFPLYPSKFIMIVGAGLMFLQLLVDIVHVVRDMLPVAARSNAGALTN
jgi:TRAP-type C4-dicarboxylate transport system permease small subunit